MQGDGTTDGAMRPSVVPPTLPSQGGDQSAASVSSQSMSSVESSTNASTRSLDRSLIPARRAFASFLASTTCYDALPASSKVVVFDVTVPLRLAFYALVENEVTAAPLWDSARGEFAGMVTVTDFSQILLEYHKRGTAGGPSTAAQALNRHTLASWKQFQRMKAEEVRMRQAAADGSPLPVWDYPHGLVQIPPEQTLLDAVRLLASNSIHRVAVVPSDAAAGAEEEEDAEDAEVQAVAAAAGRELAAAAASAAGDSGGAGPSSALADTRAGGLGASSGRQHETVGLARRLARQREIRRGRGGGRAGGARPGGSSGEAQEGAAEHEGAEAHRHGVMSAREGMLYPPPSRTMALGLLTYGTVLEHLAERFKSTTALAGLDTPVGHSGVGVWGADRVVHCTTETPLVDVLRVVAQRRLAAVPLVDPSSRVLVDLWSRDDVLFLATDPGLTVLDAPVKRTRRAQVAASGGVTALRVCRPTDSLRRVVDTFTATRCYCVVGVDQQGKPCGMVTLSDLFRFCIGPMGASIRTSPAAGADAGPRRSRSGSAVAGSRGDGTGAISDAGSTMSGHTAPSRIHGPGPGPGDTMTPSVAMDAGEETEETPPGAGDGSVGPGGGTEGKSSGQEKMS